jgi:hypothetical protein
MSDFAEPRSTLVSDIGQSLNEFSQRLSQIHDLEIAKDRYQLKELGEKLAEIKNRQFSFFDILGIENNESVHSNFLAWLLTPNENHGLGVSFTEKMLKLIASKNPTVDVNGIDFSRLVVKREESREQGRLDIRIFDPSGLFQCVIENKIKSAEGERQTKRYYEDWSGYYQNEVFVFLTLDPNQKPTDKENYISLNYEEIKDLLLEIHPTFRKTKFLIKNYLHTLEGIIMASKFQKFSDKSKLYFEYYKQIKEVERAWDKDRQSLLSTMQQELTDYLSKMNTAWRVEKNGRAVLIFKKNWHAKAEKGISFWVQPSYSEASVDLYVYSMPEEFNKKYFPYFQKELAADVTKIPLSEFKKSLGGGSLSLKRSIPLNQEDSLSLVIAKTKEMISYFEKTIDDSIAEFKKKEGITLIE